jgi:hypothetical protein
MTRPAHIAPLDAALFESLGKIDEADAAVAAFLDEHLDVLDAYDEVLHKRADVYGAVRSIEDAIRQLGYVVVLPDGGTVSRDEGVLGKRSYAAHDDRRAARERRGTAADEPPCPSWRLIDGGNDTASCDQTAGHEGLHTRHRVPSWTDEDARLSAQMMDED